MSTDKPDHLSAATADLDRGQGIPGDIEIVNDAQKALEAVHLVRLGARAALVCQLTGLTKKVVGRLYARLTGMPSPPGQVPFTDTWYLKSNRRMLDANLVWHLFVQLEHTGCSGASVLIHVYEAYLDITDAPVLSLTRASFVPRLVTMHLWYRQICDYCTMHFIAPLEQVGATCPVCIDYFNYRCRRCGTAIGHRTAGRRRVACSGCHRNQKKGKKHSLYRTING